MLPENNATLSITDAPIPAVTVTATQPDAVRPTGSSGPTDGEITISRSGDMSQSLAISVTTSGSATAGEDYDVNGNGSSAFTVTLGAGQASATLSVDPHEDDGESGDETAVFNLTDGSGYSVGEGSSATVTIADPDDSGDGGGGDEEPATIEVAEEQNGVEATAGGSATAGKFTVTRTDDGSGNVTVNLGLGTPDGAAYTAVWEGGGTFDGTVHFGGGSPNTQTLDIVPIADTPGQGPQHVTLAIESGTGYTGDGNATLAITIPLSRRLPAHCG